MATKNTILVRITKKFSKNTASVDLAPMTPGETMKDFFSQFVGKNLEITVRDLTPTCGNQICKSFGICQGHWTEEELKDETKPDGENK